MGEWCASFNPGFAGESLNEELRGVAEGEMATSLPSQGKLEKNQEKRGALRAVSLSEWLISVDPKWSRRIERRSTRLFSVGCWSLMWSGFDIWTSWLTILGCDQCKRYVPILHKSRNEGKGGVNHDTRACHTGLVRVLVLPSFWTWLTIRQSRPKRGETEIVDEETGINHGGNTPGFRLLVSTSYRALHGESPHLNC